MNGRTHGLTAWMKKLCLPYMVGDIKSHFGLNLIFNCQQWFNYIATNCKVA